MIMMIIRVIRFIRMMTMMMKRMRRNLYREDKEANCNEASPLEH